VFLKFFFSLYLYLKIWRKFKETLFVVVLFHISIAIINWLSSCKLINWLIICLISCYFFRR
jgi:hypothetical protein